MFSYSDKYNRFILDVGTLDAYPKSPLCIWLDKIGKDNAAALQKMQYNWVVVLLLEDSCRRYLNPMRHHQRQASVPEG